MKKRRIIPLPKGSVMGEKGVFVQRDSRNRGTAMPKSPEVAVVRAFIATINGQDLATLSSLMPEDHQFADSGGSVMSGRETMLAAWRQYFAMFPDYRIRVDSMMQHDTIVTVFGSWSGTYAGKRGAVPENAVSGPAVWRALVENAKNKTWQVYADQTETAEVVKRNQSQGE
ncbi:MAG TPA: nuclear transport factor 2 family protein [Candidatus Paceibacterota bacterium]|nr:nuclear transport factor 2 family protein [Verrucomicrobiota bacterium]HRY48126.1 nuclear transport factor 2 family protein [Candidatus Paceibacterota bacterium]HSA00607.1 nuclear transport factor 2 family protein [Candidatus Paceibacterota bacterium]